MKTREFKLEEGKGYYRATSSESKVCGTSVLEFLYNLWGLYRNQVGIGRTGPPRLLHRLVELIFWNRFLGSLKCVNSRSELLFLHDIGLPPVTIKHCRIMKESLNIGMVSVAFSSHFPCVRQRQQAPTNVIFLNEIPNLRVRQNLRSVYTSMCTNECIC